MEKSPKSNTRPRSTILSERLLGVISNDRLGSCPAIRCTETTSMHCLYLPRWRIPPGTRLRAARTIHMHRCESPWGHPRRYELVWHRPDRCSSLASLGARAPALDTPALKANQRRLE